MIHSCYLITTQSHIHMCHVSEKFIICFAWLRQQFKLRPVAKTLLFCFCVCVYILLLFLCRTSQSAICILNAKQTHFIHWCDEFWLNTNAIAIRSHANINVEVANRHISFRISNSMGIRLLESFQRKLSLDSLGRHRISMSRIPLEQSFISKSFKMIRYTPETNSHSEIWKTNFVRLPPLYQWNNWHKRFG